MTGGEGQKRSRRECKNRHPALAVYFEAARMRFPLSVTAPVRAKTRPVTLAPVVTVPLIFARMLPSKAVLVPSVAELPTCQNAFPAVVPLARMVSLVRN